ncbi:MAG TPA: rod-binding protein [Clostridia bacterium]|nr:rod-binding protein [Clostridia bacterium]
MEIIGDPTILHKRMEGIKENQDDEALKQVCKDFESIFLSIMFKEMKKTLPEDGLIEKSAGTKIFEDMYTEELSKEVANTYEGLGIADMLYNQFKNGYVNW